MSTTATTMFDDGRAAPTSVVATGGLFDRDLVLKFMAAGAFWLVFAPTVGAIVAIKFNYYDFLGHISWLTWGRLRPVHVMGVVFGGFSTAARRTSDNKVPRAFGPARAKQKSGGRGFLFLEVFSPIPFRFPAPF